jgi:hypothetical protein
MWPQNRSPRTNMVGWLILLISLFLTYAIFKWRWFILGYVIPWIIPKSRLSSQANLNETGRALCITYDRIGKTYHFNVPFSRQLMVRSMGLKVYLIQDGGPELDITQQPGLPYLVTAEMLGGTGLKVRYNGQTKLLGPTEKIDLESILSTT